MYRGFGWIEGAREVRLSASDLGVTASRTRDEMRYYQTAGEERKMGRLPLMRACEPQ